MFPAHVREDKANRRVSLLCFFACDPPEKAGLDWMAGLDAQSRQAIRMLKEEGLSSVRQIRQIDEQRAAFGNSCARMLEEWKAFSERPRDDSARQEFLHALSHVQPTKDFMPEEFC